jgi:3-methylfumaryl-CoA hydratase
MMLELVRNEFPEKKIVNFQFRAIAPIFDTTYFEVCGRKLSGSEIEIWVRRDDDVLAMMGSAKIIED